VGFPLVPNHTIGFRNSAKHQKRNSRHRNRALWAGDRKPIVVLTKIPMTARGTKWGRLPAFWGTMTRGGGHHRRENHLGQLPNRFPKAKGRWGWGTGKCRPVFFPKQNGGGGKNPPKNLAPPKCKWVCWKKPGALTWGGKKPQKGWLGRPKRSYERVLKTQKRGGYPGGILYDDAKTRVPIKWAGRGKGKAQTLWVCKKGKRGKKGGRLD